MIVASGKFSLETIGYAERLRGAKNFDECWELYLSEIRHFGFATALYGFIPHWYPRKDTPTCDIILTDNHPADFMARYDEAGHLQFDPSIGHCRTSEKPIRWYDPSYMNGLSRRELQVEDDARDFGLRNGLSIPLRFDQTLSWGGVGLNAGDMPDREFTGLLEAYLPELTHLTAVFHDAVIERSYLQSFVQLTQRENECLLWAMTGSPISEAASRMGLKPETVKRHLFTARKKLRARTTTHAVSRALTLNLLHP